MSSASCHCALTARTRHVQMVLALVLLQRGTEHNRSRYQKVAEHELKRLLFS